MLLSCRDHLVGAAFVFVPYFTVKSTSARLVCMRETFFPFFDCGDLLDPSGVLGRRVRSVVWDYEGAPGGRHS